MMEKILLTPEEAANALGIGRWKLYDLLRRGSLDSIRIGACRRIPAAALSELIASIKDTQDDWPS